MANPVVRVLSDTGEEYFNSWTDDVLFFLEEHWLTSGNYDSNGQVVFSYPAYAGRQIAAFIVLCNYSTLEDLRIPSCRITYPNGIPTVTVFLDNDRTDISIAPGMLSVMLSGG